MATPETALALLRRSALGPESVASVFLAWPECWPDGESLATFMQDLDKDAQDEDHYISPDERLRIAMARQ